MKAPFRSPYQINSTYNEYGNTSFNWWYKAQGVTAPFHNGIDITFGTTSRQCYGTEIVCPEGKWKVVKVTWDTPTSTKGNGVTIESAPKDGKIYQVVLWHSGEIVAKLGQELNEGDVICYIGNSGLVAATPTKENPWVGAHCHLMLFKCLLVDNKWVWQNMDNGVNGAINPRELFDFSKWYIGKDTGVIHDGWVLKQWLVNLSGSALVKYIKSLGL